MFIYDNVWTFNILSFSLSFVIEVFHCFFENVSCQTHHGALSTQKMNVFCFGLLIYIYYTSTEKTALATSETKSNKQFYVSIKFAENELTRKGFFNEFTDFIITSKLKLIRFVLFFSFV